MGSFSLVVTALCFGAAAASSMSSVPLFMWSPQQYFRSTKCADSESTSRPVSTAAFAQGLRRLAKAGQQGPETSLAELLAIPPTRPEAIVAFIYSNLDSATCSQAAGGYSEQADGQPALQYLHQALNNAKSCAAVPYVTVDEGTTISKTMIRALSSSANVVAVQLGPNNCDSVLGELEEKAFVFSNDATDLVLVRADKSFDADCMERVMNMVGSKADNNFVALLASDKAPAVAMNFEQPEEAQHRKFVTMSLFQAQEATNAPGPPGPPSATDGVQYVTTPIIEGLMLGFFLLLFLWVGVGCLLSVDTPQRFATENLPVPKEY